MLIYLNACVACPDYVLPAGKVFDVSPKLAAKLMSTEAGGIETSGRLLRRSCLDVQAAEQVAELGGKLVRVKLREVRGIHQPFAGVRRAALNRIKRFLCVCQVVFDIRAGLLRGSCRVARGL